MASFFAKAKQMANKAKDRVVDSTKKGYEVGGTQGSRAADNIETRSTTTKSEGEILSETQNATDTDTFSETTPTTTTGETKTEPEPTWKTAVKVTGNVFGAIAGMSVGVARAAYGVPKDIMRERAKTQQKTGMEKGWGPRELARIHAPAGLPIDKMPVRVICVRHGHGFHNDVGGLSNVGNRDALLSPLGIEQAQSLGNELREREIHFDMIVVSPMRRTLETSIHILGNDIMKSTNVETIVQPLAAEHNGGTFTNNRINQVRSVVARGDLGSSPDELRKTFDFATYPQFKEFNGLENEWWKHGQEDGFETNESFELRAKNLRTWLGSTGRELTNKRKRNGNSESESDSLPTILLVSHGGILSKTFDFGSDGTTEFARSGGKMQNCEIRVFDVSESGDYIRPIGKDECEVMDVGDGLIGGGGGGGGSSGGGSSGAAFVNDDKNTEEDAPSLLAPARPPRPTRR